MNCLHYAVYFECDDIVDQLCEYNPGQSINSSYSDVSLLYLENVHVRTVSSII